MASELRVDTLKDSSGSNSVGMAYVAGGSAKAWVNFNGTGTIAARDSFNQTSLTDLAAGEYTVSYTNNLNNANYAPHVTSTSNNGYNIDGCSLACIASNLTNPYVNTGNVSVMTSIGANGNGQDSGAVVMAVSVLGDLA